jgi:hypothetical protein
VADFVYLDSFSPLSGDSCRWLLPGNAVMKAQSPGSPAVAWTGRTLLRAVVLDHYDADSNVPSHAFGVALPPRLLAPATPGGRQEHRRAGVSWRCDGR